VAGGEVSRHLRIRLQAHRAFECQDVRRIRHDLGAAKGRENAILVGERDRGARRNGTRSLIHSPGPPSRSRRSSRRRTLPSPPPRRSIRSLISGRLGAGPQRQASSVAADMPRAVLGGPHPRPFPRGAGEGSLATSQPRWCRCVAQVPGARRRFCRALAIHLGALSSARPLWTSQSFAARCLASLAGVTSLPQRSGSQSTPRPVASVLPSPAPRGKGGGWGPLRQRPR
jgi:hypothetical protein